MTRLAELNIADPVGRFISATPRCGSDQVLRHAPVRRGVLAPDVLCTGEVEGSIKGTAE